MIKIIKKFLMKKYLEKELAYSKKFLAFLIKHKLNNNIYKSTKERIKELEELLKDYD